MTKLCNVYAVPVHSCKDTENVELIEENTTEKNADAIVMMCVMCRGVDTHFFTDVEVGSEEDKDLKARIIT